MMINPTRIIGMLGGDGKHLIVNTSDGSKPIPNSAVTIKDKNTGAIVASGFTNQAGGVRFPITQFKTMNDLEIQISSSGFKNYRVDVNPKAAFHSYFVNLEPRSTGVTGTGVTGTGVVGTTGTGEKTGKTGDNKPKFSIMNMKAGYVFAGVAALAILIFAFTATSKK